MPCWTMSGRRSPQWARLFLLRHPAPVKQRAFRSPFLTNCGRNGKILVLEPRRIAARAAAERMAANLGSRLGDDIGLRARLNSKTGPRVAVEVVTEGVFTRMILDDPELKGVAAVLFDEFHERSLDADLGLALALEARQALRPDLKILVMSATLEAASVSKLLGGAPTIKSEGRAFPIETRYPGRRAQRIEDDVVDAVLRTIANDDGSILVFLPGPGRDCARRRTAFRANVARNRRHRSPVRWT